MVGSLVVGITASIIGASEKRPYLASSHAFSRYSREGLIMISGCCGPSTLPGIAVRSGSSESARLTLAEGLRFLKVPSSPTSSSGRCCAPSSERSVVWGWAPETTTPASILVPSDRVTPVVRTPTTPMAATSALVRISAPAALAEAAIASETPPIPPRTKPQPPVTPSISPILWCKSTHADDATRGERALYSLIHEVAVEKVCATHRHQVDEPRDALPVPKSVTPEIERLRQVGKRTDAGIRRPPVEERSYEIGQLAKIMAVRPVCLAIPGVDPAYLLGRMHRVVPEQESRTVREGGEVGRVERVDVVAVPGEV